MAGKTKKTEEQKLREEHPELFDTRDHTVTKVSANINE